MLFGLLPMPGLAEVLVLLSMAAMAALVIWPAWRICAKAGFPGPLGLLAPVPGLNLVLMFILAFVEWPALQRGGSETGRAGGR
jgi:energy-converting hydrogenase Eha subunit B